ncbi:MAG: DNA cytosine methyltransferase [Oscillospiraceae bacterium]|nr:DNA cytosine methyltransferase [Oscillospiraceae bacterium]
MKIQPKKNNTTHDSIAIFSFFSGSGFLDLGFEKAGYNVVLVNEISPSFLSAYKHSRLKMDMAEPDYGYFNLDINDFLNGRKEELRQLIDKSRASGQLVGFIGGPPCPDFSIAGKNKGADGLNGKLSIAYINLIADTEPDFFLFENVKGLWSTARHKMFFEELKEKLHNAGYSTAERLCNALEFAVPQDRERVLFFGVKTKLVRKNATDENMLTAFPWKRFATYNADEVKAMSWCKTNALGADINPTLTDEMTTLTVQYWFDKNDVEHHPNAKKHFVPRSPKIKTVQEGDVSRKSCKRLHRYRYSPTAAYGNNEVHLHPHKERRISAAEAMAIQSLPKEFELPPDMTLSDMFKTIGNGVPYLLSNGIAKTIKVYLEENICKS